MCLGFYLTSVSSDARCRSQHRMSASTFVSCRIRILATRLSATLASHPRIEPRASSSGFRPFILSNCTGLVRIRAFHSRDSVFPCLPRVRRRVPAVINLPPLGCRFSGVGGRQPWMPAGEAYNGDALVTPCTRQRSEAGI
eukprot:jgi/Botrbrau1/5508/Bobra.27_1s0045.1